MGRLTLSLRAMARGLISTCVTGSTFSHYRCQIEYLIIPKRYFLRDSATVIGFKWQPQRTRYDVSR